jgi:hypothetical protein
MNLKTLNLESLGCRKRLLVRTIMIDEIDVTLVTISVLTYY